jgi:hypothetical protein
MRRQHRVLRPTHLVAALLVLPFAGWKTFKHFERRASTPFVLWDFRAGMNFETLEKEAARQAKGHFTCHVVVDPARLCELRVSGIPGLVRVLVDPRDRAAIIQFLPDSASPTMREEGRRIAAGWSLVRSGVADQRESNDAKTSTTRWSSEDQKWTALMRYGRLGTTPIAVQLTEHPAVKSILASVPLAPLVLVMNDLVEPREVSNLKALTSMLEPAYFRRHTAPTSETATPLLLASQLPICEPVPDLIERGTDSRREELDDATRAVLMQAVARVYPGSQLVFGQGTWIVDSNGRSERLVMQSNELGMGGEEGVSVFAMHFPSRSALAAERMADARPDVFCRAPAEVLFVRRAEDGSLAEVHRVPIDHEAIASEISTFEVSPANVIGDPPHIRVRYTAVYATDRWTGSIDWEAVIADDPPQPVVRVPLQFALQTHGSEEVRGGTIVMTGRPTGSVELSTLEQYDWGHTTRTILVPIDSSGVLLGARILTALH